MLNLPKLNKNLVSLWLILTIIYFYNNINKNYLLSGSIALLGQIIPDLFIAIIAYRKSRKKELNSLILKLIAISFGFALVADLNYNLTLNIYLSDITALNNLLFEVPFISFLLSQVYTWYVIFITYYDLKSSIKLNIINFPYYLAGLIIFCVFIFSEWKIEYYSTPGLINIIITILESICFVCAIFCLNILRVYWLKLYSVGLQIILLSDILIRYAAINNLNIPCNPFEITWILGLVFIVSSLCNGNLNEQIPQTFRTSRDLATAISISIFSISIISLLLFFLVNTLVSIVINDSLHIGAKYLPVSIVLFSTISSIMSVYISNYIQKILDKVKHTINQIEKDSLTNSPPKNLARFNIREINEFINFMIISFKLKALAIEQERNYSIASKQMAHDIRSPIFVLNLLASNATDLPENERRLIKNVSRRINEIANSFLHFNTNLIENTKPKSSALLISSIIHSLLDEKSIECNFKNIDLCHNISSNVQATFIESNEQDLYRAFSNIINNAIEASTNSNSKININVSLFMSQIIISIEDNGIGIPKHILPNLFKQNYSYSKTDGKGLGLHYAKSVIEALGGNIKLNSTLNKGTIVTITLNPSPTPLWFCQEIVLPKNYNILILDDCENVQVSWKRKFISKGFKHKILYLRTISEFINYIEKNGSKNVFYIIDYELNDKMYNGIQLITRYNLQNNSVLSTGHSMDSEIISKCQFFNIKMLPKDYAHQVNIIATPS